MSEVLLLYEAHVLPPAWSHLTHVTNWTDCWHIKEIQGTSDLCCVDGYSVTRSTDYNYNLLSVLAN